MPHEPVPGRMLVGGASRLFYGRQPPQAAATSHNQAAPAKGVSRVDLESRESAAVWQQWSGGDD